MIVSRACDNCQEMYSADTRYLNRGQGKFCSRKCSGEWKTNNTRSKDPNTECAFCGAHFYRMLSKKNSKSGLYFCSKEHQNLGFLDRNIDVTPGPSSLPTITGKKFYYSECTILGCKNQTKNKICRSCLKITTIKTWLSGDLSVTYCGNNREPKTFVKQYLIETRGDACEVCGFNGKAPDGRSIIQMDHIDGNYLNNHIDNLKLLCPNHHAMTPTYGRLNKSGGREHRRKLSGT